MVLEIPPADEGVDHRQHRRCLADGAGGRRAGRRRQGQGRQVPDPAAGLQGHGARRLHRAAVARPTRATRCCARTSRAAATPTSPRRSPMASGSSSIRCRRRRIRPTTKFVDAIDVVFDAPSPTTCASSRSLDRFVQREPWLERDKAMIDMLKIDRHREGQAVQARRARRRRSSTTPRARRTPGSTCRYEACSRRRSTKAAHWALPGIAGSGRRHADRLRRSRRLSGRRPRRRLLLWRSSAPSISGAGQYYLMTIADKDGKPLDGGKTYRLTRARRTRR